MSMAYNIKTIAYFTIWGLILGALLGIFSGTAILPYFGTMYAAIWGTGIGLACGIISGIVAAVIRAKSFNEDTDLDGFRRYLSTGIGGLTAIAAPIILVLTTNGLLWGSGLLSDMLPWTAFSIFSASFWGGLSAAYIASYYPAYIARLTARDEYEEIEIERPHPRREISHAWSTMMRAGLTRWVFLLGAVGGGLVNLMNGVNMDSVLIQSTSMGEGVAYFAIGGLLGIIGTFFLGLYVSFGNSTLITFLKRLIFREYFPHLPTQWTRWILTLTAFVFTGAVTYWTAIFAPVIALIAAMTVYRTLALPDETPDKAKRKEKNALALEDIEDEKGEEELIDEERVMADRKQR